MFGSAVTLCARRFVANDGGNIAVAFSLALPLVAATIGSAVDYSRATQMQNRLKLAADEAVLAATTASGNGASSEMALQIAQKVWMANTSGVTDAAIKPAFVINNASGTITAEVKFSGTMPTTFARMMGVQQIDINGGSSTLGKMKQLTTQKYSGTGGAYGDPHMIGADGYVARFTCPNPSWYNMLSDGGVEVNVSCYHLTTGPYAGTDIIADETVIIGSHTISLHQAPPQSDFTWLPTDQWRGKVTVDGTDYTPGAGATALAQWDGASVMANINDGGRLDKQSDDNITITTPQYVIKLGFEYNNGGVINLTATNAGVCGMPGGLWGNTLAGVNDTTVDANDANSIDASAFAVDSASSTAAEFGRTPCVTNIASDIKLTQ